MFSNVLYRSIFALTFLTALLLLCARQLRAQTMPNLLVQAGDTWQALSWRFGADVLALNPQLNPQQQPAIGSGIVVPDSAENSALLRRIQPQRTQSLIALANNVSLSQLFAPATLTRAAPLLVSYSAVLIPQDSATIRDLPVGFGRFELSHTPALPGQGMAYRGLRIGENQPLSVTLRTTSGDPLTFDTFNHQRNHVGLRGTGAFFPLGTQELQISAPDTPLWSQPWLFVDDEWEFQEITFTSAAAQIDNTAIADERVRMFALWSVDHPDPFWRSEFQPPIREADIYAYTSGYGARRSYNGGPYSSYHEGVDFAAFEGVDALASTEGVVVLAEQLYVRGGAVIIAHGLGIYSGYYHLSDVQVNPGDIVEAGQKVGEVGTTGLSTGNHLHWDFLVTDTWVGADKWSERGMGCWLLEGLGKQCQQTSPP